MPVKQLQPTELAPIIDDDDVVVIDVREPWELEIAKLDAAIPIPMAEIADRLDQLKQQSAGKRLVVMCRSGGRSQAVAEFLNQKGLSDVFNLDGGILGWSELVDPDVPRY